MIAMPPRKRAPLRSVAADEKPPTPPGRARAKRKTVSQAVELTERDLLVALRAKIAADIDRGVPAHALAGLSKQIRELDKEVRAIDLRAEAEREADGADEDEGATEDEAFDSEAL